MKILSASQIRQLDKYTIEQEMISSHDLMERAAVACAEWIEEYYDKSRKFFFFCGPGNNGGDGMAIARILFKSGYDVRCFLIDGNAKRSEDLEINLKLLREINTALVEEIKSEDDLPFLPGRAVLIEALFGTGLARPLTGIFSTVVNYLNESGHEIISIDLPSGLSADRLPSSQEVIILAGHTLTFQLPKFSFFFPSTEVYTGSWHILDIGLSQHFLDGLPVSMYYTEHDDFRDIIKPRKRFSHKGNYGHVLLVCGSKGKAGAAVLAASACLRSGAGLLTVHVPSSALEILQISCPEAMVSVDTDERECSDRINTDIYSVIATGPGSGTGKAYMEMLRHLLKRSPAPMVLDADALNTLSLYPELLKNIPPYSIITPHIKEFERLAGKADSDAKRHQLQKEFSEKHKVITVLKGANTCISSPDGQVYFNSSGNPGMAKGGFGDVLTGLIAGLLAQSISPVNAAVAGVFLHGLAGDIACEKYSAYAMTAMDLVRSLPEAYRRL